MEISIILYRGVSGSTHTRFLPAICARRESADCCPRNCAHPSVLGHVPCVLRVFSAALSAFWDSVHIVLPEANAKCQAEAIKWRCTELTLWRLQEPEVLCLISL